MKGFAIFTSKRKDNLMKKPAVVKGGKGSKGGKGCGK